MDLIFRLIYDEKINIVRNVLGVEMRVFGFGDILIIEYLDIINLILYFKLMVDMLVFWGYKWGFSVRVVLYDFCYGFGE